MEKHEQKQKKSERLTKKKQFDFLQLAVCSWKTRLGLPHWKERALL